MTRATTLRRCAVAALPIAGTAALAFAFWPGPLPSAAELEQLRQTTLELQRERHRLMLTPPPSATALTEQLPQTVTVGALLHRLERAARQAGVRAVSFGTEGDADPEQHDEAKAEVAAPLEINPTAQPAAPDAPQPEVLRCEITVEAEFGALVQFLGLIEAMPALTRVRSLSITPLPEGVSATIGLSAYAYAGDGREVASTASLAPPPTASPTAEGGR